VKRRRIRSGEEISEENSIVTIGVMAARKRLGIDLAKKTVSGNNQPCNIAEKRRGENSAKASESDIIEASKYGGDQRQRQRHHQRTQPVYHAAKAYNEKMAAAA
jgi:hypothetical protein